MGPSGTLWTRLLSGAGELAELISPTPCAGCGAEGVSLCARCLPGMATPVLTAVPRYGTAPVTAAGAYSGVLRAGLVAYKDAGRRDLTDLLGLQLARAITACLEQAPGRGPVVLVPVPATRRAARARGGNHVTALAERAAEVLACEGLRVRVAEILTVARHRDQVGQSQRSRRRNVRGTHRIAPGLTPRARQALAAHRVILIDDICTTGATVAEAVRALRAGGILACGTAVVAQAVDARTGGQNDM